MIYDNRIYAETVKEQSIFTNHNRKGQIAFSVGYNQAGYAISSARIRGDGYDFEVQGLRATRQEDFLNSLFPGVYSAPQYEFALDYFIDHSVQISFQFRHFKYWIDEGNYSISGNPPTNSENLNFHLEHTDGLNLFNIFSSYHFDLLNIQKILLSFYLGGSVGIAFPYTDIRFANESYTSGYQVSGLGISVDSGFRFEFLKYFFTDLKFTLGYIFLIRVPFDDGRIALSQNLGYSSLSISVGTQFSVLKKKN